MDTDEVEQHLHRMIDDISDEGTLQAVEDFLLAELGRDIKPMSFSEFNERINQSEEDIKAGRVTSQEDLEGESEDW